MGRNAQERRKARKAKQARGTVVATSRRGEHAIAHGWATEDGCPVCLVAGSGDVATVMAAMTAPPRHGPPEGWTVCEGEEIEHDDGVSECTLGGDCSSVDQLHSLGVSCGMVPVELRANLTHRCPSCR